MRLTTCSHPGGKVALERNWQAHFATWIPKRGKKEKKREKRLHGSTLKVILSHPTARTSTTISVTFGDTNTRTSVKTKRRTVTIVVEHVSRAPRSWNVIKGWNVPALQHKNATMCTETHFKSTRYIVVKLPITPPPEHKNTHTHSQTPYVGLL